MDGSEDIGTLYLEVEARNLRAGEELTGVIHLKLNQVVQARSLTLEFTGTESCGWEISDGYVGTTRLLGDAEIVRQKTLVFAFPGGFIAPGHFTFPFRYKLPSDLPGSFHLKNRLLDADILYVLRALIEGPDNKVKEDKVEICISQLPQTASRLSSAVNVRVGTYFCGHQGSVQMQSKFHQNANVPGKTAEVAVTVINNSKVDISCISGTLIRTLKVRDNNGRTTMKTLSSKTVKKYQIVRAGERTARDDRIRFEISTLCSKEELLQTPSVYGTKIECVSRFEVKAELNRTWKTTCLGAVPKVTQLVVLDPAQLPDMKVSEVPLDWHPLVRLSCS